MHTSIEDTGNNQLNKCIELSTISQKDEQYIQTLNNKIIQCYLSNQSPQNSQQFILFNELIKQFIHNKQCIKNSSLECRLQVQKTQLQSNITLYESIKNTIQHVKNPINLSINIDIIIQSLRQKPLYQFGCLIIQRYYKSRIQQIIQKQEINKIIQLICQGCDNNINVASQTLLKILDENNVIDKSSRIINFVQEIINEKLIKIAQNNKLQFVNCMKIIKISTNYNNSFILNKQNIICSIIYRFPYTISHIQQILQLSYNKSYCNTIHQNMISQDTINIYYVWSYCQNFSKQITDKEIESLQILLTQCKIQNNFNISQQLQCKIYTTIYNTIKKNYHTINKCWNIPIHSQQNIDIYLQMVMTLIQYNPQQIHINFKMDLLEDAFMRINNKNQKRIKYIKNIKQLISKKSVSMHSKSQYYYSNSTIHSSMSQKNEINQIGQKQQKIKINKIKIVVIVLRAFKKLKSMSKKSKTRFYKLRQLAETQKNYWQKKLLVLKNQILKPLITNSLLDQMQQQNIAPNIDSMIKLSELMKKEIYKLVQSWCPIKTQLANPLSTIAKYLKIYKDYSFQYQSSFKRIKQIQKNSQFTKYVKLSQLDIQDCLISPVQRFLKYHLFAEEYVKLLPKVHTDYQTLSNVLAQLKKVNSQINEHITLQKKKQKMISFDTIYGNLISNNRQYLDDIIAKYDNIPCKIHMFNNLILVVKMEKYNKQIDRIQLSSHSFIQLQPDYQQYTNRVYICGKSKSIHLTFNTKQQQYQYYNMVHKQIQNMSQNQIKRKDVIWKGQLRKNQLQKTLQLTKRVSFKKQSFQVNFKTLVLYFDQRKYTNAKVKTYVVIKISVNRLEGASQILYCQLQLLNKLYEFIKLRYPQIQVPKLDFIQLDLYDENNYYGYNQFVQQWMKLQIFLNCILRNPIISQKPQLILHKLGLNQYLWEYAMRKSHSMQCYCDTCKSALSYNERTDYYYQQKNRMSQNDHKFCIFNSIRTLKTVKTKYSKDVINKLSLQQKLIWANSQIGRLNYQLTKKKSFGKPISFTVKIRLLSYQECINVDQITKYSTVRDVIEKICKKMKILTTLDIALVIRNSSEQIILDDDQYIYNILTHVIGNAHEEMKLNLGIQKCQKNRVSSVLNYAFYLLGQNEEKVLLYLQKIIVLDQILQEKACQLNTQRYQFVIGEILRKYKNNYHNYKQQQIIKICSIVYSLQNYGIFQNYRGVNIDTNKLKRYIPDNKHHIITKQFIDTVLVMMIQMKKNKKNIQQLYKGIIGVIGEDLQWNYQYFSVINTNNCFEQGTYLCIGISYNKLIILQSGKKKTLLQLNVGFNLKCQIYADTLFIESQGIMYEFSGSNLFILYKLIVIYQHINSIEISRWHDKYLMIYIINFILVMLFQRYFQNFLSIIQLNQMLSFEVFQQLGTCDGPSLFIFNSLVMVIGILKLM